MADPTPDGPDHVLDERGFIFLWRKIEDSGLLADAPTCALFLWLALHARVTPARVLPKYGKPVFLRRGQVLCGRAQLAAILNQSERRIRTGLARLTEIEAVTSTSTSAGTIITVVNYDNYNPRRGEKWGEFVARVTNGRPTLDQRPTNGRPLSKPESPEARKPESKSPAGRTLQGGGTARDYAKAMDRERESDRRAEEARSREPGDLTALSEIQTMLDRKAKA